jgi:hypothetical protein
LLTGAKLYALGVPSRLPKGAIGAVTKFGRFVTFIAFRAAATVNSRPAGPVDVRLPYGYSHGKRYQLLFDSSQTGMCIWHWIGRPRPDAFPRPSSLESGTRANCIAVNIFRKNSCS